MRLTLTRYYYGDDMTLGRLQVGDVPMFTVERPWRANKDGFGGVPRVSCVPDGVYSVRPHDSERFPGTFALVNEELGVWYQSRPKGQSWGRTAILIHTGNVVQDVIGCIAVGMDTGTIGGSRAVLASHEAMGVLNTRLGRSERHELLIKPARTEEVWAP